jgi:hypothetical protein
VRRREPKRRYEVWNVREPRIKHTVSASSQIQAREIGADILRVPRFDVNAREVDAAPLLGPTKYKWVDPPWWGRNPDAQTRELEKAAKAGDSQAIMGWARALEREDRRLPFWLHAERYALEGGSDPYLLRGLRFAASGQDDLVTYPNGRTRQVQNLGWLLRNTYRSGGSLTGRLLPLRFVVRTLPVAADEGYRTIPRCYLLVELSDGTRDSDAEAYVVRDPSGAGFMRQYHSACYHEASKPADSRLRGRPIERITPYLQGVCHWCREQDPFLVTHTFETLWAGCRPLWDWLQRPTFYNENLDWDGRTGIVARMHDSTFGWPVSSGRQGGPRYEGAPDAECTGCGRFYWSGDPGAHPDLVYCPTCYERQQRRRRRNPGGTDQRLRELERRAASGGREDVFDLARFAARSFDPSDPEATSLAARQAMNLLAFDEWQADRKNKDLIRAYGLARTAAGLSARSPYADWNEAAEAAGKPLVMQPLGGLPRGLRSWLFLNEDQVRAVIDAAPEKHRDPAPKKKPRRLKVAEAEKVVKAWLHAKDWRPDYHPSSRQDIWISPNAAQRVVFKRTALRFEEGGRRSWGAWGLYQPYMETLRTIDFANYLLTNAKRAVHHAAPNPGSSLLARAKRGDKRAQQALFRKALDSGRIPDREVKRLVAGCDSVVLAVTGDKCGQRELLAVVGRKNRFNGEQAGKVIRAHYYEQGWKDDPRSRGKGLISPDGKQKLRLTARTYQRFSGGRGAWKKAGGGSKIGLAEELVAKARR